MSNSLVETQTFCQTKHKLLIETQRFVNNRDQIVCVVAVVVSRRAVRKRSSQGGVKGAYPGKYKD